MRNPLPEVVRNVSGLASRLSGCVQDRRTLLLLGDRIVGRRLPVMGAPIPTTPYCTLSSSPLGEFSAGAFSEGYLNSRVVQC